MRRLVAERSDGTVALIEIEGGIEVEVPEAVSLSEIKDKKSWDNVQKNRTDRDKVRKIIGDKRSE